MSQERERILTAAVHARKIHVKRVGEYRKMYDADPAGITRLLTAPVTKGGLMAGIADAERFASGSAAPVVPDDTDEYPAGWLPEVTRHAAGQVPAPAAPEQVPAAQGADDSYPTGWLPEVGPAPSGGVLNSAEGATEPLAPSPSPAGLLPTPGTSAAPTRGGRITVGDD